MTTTARRAATPGQTPAQRDALTLRLEELTYRDIATRLNRSHGTASNLVSRALTAMQRRINHLPRYHGPRR